MKKKMSASYPLYIATLVTAAASFSVNAASGPSYVQIPEGDASTSLRLLAEQTGIQILFQPQALEGRMTHPVSGRMERIGALNRMLAGTDLLVTKVNAETVAVSLRSPVAQTDGLATALSLSQVEDGGPSGDGGGTAPSAPKEQPASIPQILVKGSRSLNSDIERTEDDIQPYVVFGEEKIRKSGAANLQDLLTRQLTSAVVISSPSQAIGTLGASSSINLRGLGPDETLILVNGRRISSVAQSGVQGQPDLNGIPLSAIERIEILPSTASGIFGGSATGGVVNVVLKQNYKGLDVRLQYGNTFSGDSFTKQLGASGGWTLEGGRTSIMLSASYSNDGVLRTGDRDFLEESRQLTLANNPAAILAATVPPLGGTTNIRSTSSVLQLKPQYGGAVLPSTITYVPYGYGGVASDNGQALVANAGSYNLDLAQTAQSAGSRRYLLTSPEVKAATGSVRRSFSDGVEGFLEFGANSNLGEVVANPYSASYTLSPSAPTNPFVQSIQVVTPAFGLDGVGETRYSSKRAVGGVVIALPADWHLAAEYSWSNTRYSTKLPSSGTPGATDVGNGSINLIRDTNLFPVDFSPYKASLNTSSGPVTTKLANPSVRLGGEVPIQLPGGRPSVTALLEYRREKLDEQHFTQAGASVVDFFYPARQQSVRSAYLESRIPLVSSVNSLPLIDLLNFQVAARTDHYTTIAANSILSINGTVSGGAVPASAKASVSSTDPTLGIQYRPIRSITIRSSYATGFLPPNVSQLVASAPMQSTIGQPGLTDPRRGNEFLTGRAVTIQSGGNPDLKPEEARSVTLGVVLEPTSIPGLRFSVDRSKIRKRDNINSLFSASDFIANEIYVPALVVRAAPTPQNDPQGFGVGPIVGLNQSLLNFSKIDINAYDLSLSYQGSPSQFGQVSFASRATRTLHYIEQLVPASPSQERAGNFGSLKWVANASIEWSLRNWSAGWQTQYYDGYWLSPTHAINVSQGSASVRSQTYHDLFVEFRSAKSPGYDVFSDVKVLFGVRNVFNKEPPIVVTEATGYSPVGDPRLARYYLSLEKSF